jgi:hypothetical protein
LIKMEIEYFSILILILYKHSYINNYYSFKKSILIKTHLRFMKSFLKYSTAAATILATANGQANTTSVTYAEPLIFDTGANLTISAQSINYGNTSLSLRIGMNATNVNLTQPNPLPTDGGLWYAFSIINQTSIQPGNVAILCTIDSPESTNASL